ncbi:MAG: hypothetical protein SFY32_12140 [Bacteroidota bacterium]|nr:hypothetical protein [Bacteroidota bacterium]
MEFKNDIYISYALRDNEAINGADGWVNNFRKFLEILLVQILGEKVSFLNYSNQEKPSRSEIEKVGLFISILSPNYVKSEACLEELSDFFKITQASNNLYVNSHSRIFKVVKFPVPLTEQPSKLLNFLSYDLFYSDEESGEISEFSDYFNSDAERKYWLKLVDIAYDISAIIRDFRNLDIAINHGEENSYSDKNVYLCETGFDLQWHRDNIKRELTRHGFRVFPDHALPLNPKEMEVDIKKDLEKCRLSIHLIGDSYGELAYGLEKSILDIQNKLASEHAHLQSAIVDDEQKFSRLIWISPSAQLLNDKQKMFVDNLRRDLEANEGAEILQSPIEDFKTVVLGELLGVNLDKIKKTETKNNNSNHSKSVYLIYDKADEFEAKKIAEICKNNQVQVITPSFEGNLLELREIHLQNLRTCDTGLVFMNNVNDLWVQMKFLDLLKAPGLGRNKGEIQKALVFGKNAKDRTNNFTRFEVPVFEFNDELQYNLSGFLNPVKV